MRIKKQFYYPPEIWRIIKEYMIHDDYDLLQRLDNKYFRNNSSDKYLYDINTNKTKNINKTIADYFDKATYYTTLKIDANIVGNNILICIPLISGVPYEFIRNFRFAPINFDKNIDIPLFNNSSNKFIDLKNITNQQLIDFEKKIIENIEYIQLEVGACRIDKIDFTDHNITTENNIYYLLKQFYKIDYIPFYPLKYGLHVNGLHQIRLNIKLKNNDNNNITPFSILYDVYDIDINALTIDTAIYQLAHLTKTISDYDINKKYELNLYINGPVYFFYCPIRLNNIKLILLQNNFTWTTANNPKKHEFKLKQDKNGLIKLTKILNSDEFANYCFNLSSVNLDVKLCFTIVDDKFNSGDNVNIYVVKSNIFSYCSGMMGLRFI